MEQNDVIIFTFNNQEYHIGKVEKVIETGELELSEIATLVPMDGKIGFIPIGLVLPTQQGITIHPIFEEFGDGNVVIERPKMFAKANSRLKEQFEQFLVSLQAKRAGIVTATDMPKDLKEINSRPDLKIVK